MARGDGIDRTNARNMRLTAAKIGNTQQHNEREKDSYVNQDIVPERTSLNVHFKVPSAGYQEMFSQMEADGVVSTRGIKADAFRYGELVFDVNSAYFYNHGGYDFAKQFYTDAYKSAIKIVGGEQYILSAVRSRSSRSLVHEAADSLKIKGAHEDTYKLSSNYLVGADGGKNRAESLSRSRPANPRVSNWLHYSGLLSSVIDPGIIRLL